MSVTKKEIADYLGISRTAVSLVLNNTPNSTVSEETRNNIWRAARELGYRDAESSPKLCYILCNRASDDPLYATDLKMIENVANRLDYRLLFMNISSTNKDYARLDKCLGNKEICGVVLSGDIDERMLAVMERSGVPYVVFSSTDRERINVVEPDVVRIAYEATRYLIGYGHRRIALFSGKIDNPVHLKTLEGYKKALAEAGLPFDKSLVQVGKDEDGYELCARMDVLGIGYTAAFCANTLIQFGALLRLKDQGIGVPSEKSLIGWGMTDFVRMSVPQLTTFHIDLSEKESVVYRLLEVIGNKDDERKAVRLNEVRLFEGGTVSRPPDSSPAVQE
ncbi:LacI family DNA-binding transcriptional regulator [Paenibacillus sp. GYB003]|uniref:LacI family DNA-binding transcriptional regulator n=1 Tax=Paenibacillus sp. GYB003 TaxID=2994392 RepID=UPI002F9632F7